MARGRFRSLGELVPKTVESLAGDWAGRGDVGPLWAQLCGGPIAKISRAEKLEAGTLFVQVDGAAWERELKARERELVARLNQHLGGRVKRLVLRLSTSAAR